MFLKIPIKAEMEDGRVLKGFIDQRDLARYEAEGLPDGKHTHVRFLAWAVLSRTKQYTGTWQQFNETDCVEAIDGAEESTDADDGLDPGQKAPSAGG